MSSFRPVRRAQLISPFGVGAMIDFPRDEALMTAGLDAWPNAYSDCPPAWKVTEERLQARLGVDHFRLPPDFRTDDPDTTVNQLEIPFVRFPRWNYCASHDCGQMIKRELFGGGTPPCRNLAHGSGRRTRLLPVRFVAICPKGHIEDFPFLEWVHGGAAPAGADSHVLRYQAGRSAALAGIWISCSCGAGRSLAGAFRYSPESGGALRAIGYECRGDQPWLGVTDGEGTSCGEHLRVVQRGGSNVYFPRTLSSIYLPLWGEETDPRIVQALEDPRVWTTLSSGLEHGTSVSRERCEAVADMRGLDANRLRDAAQRKLEGGTEQAEPDLSEEEFRRSEYEALRDARGDQATDLLVEAMEGVAYSGWTGEVFERVCLVRKLRETRVLHSFSRLLPIEADAGRNALQAEPLARSRHISWLPAMIVRGEGLFFQFHEGLLVEWAKKSDVLARSERLARQYNHARTDRGLGPIAFDARFLLMHTFAHTLIRQLSYDCGYGSAALRERLYCNREPGSEPMNGFLIYTAAGDSEGTLGGLVRQGAPGSLEPTLDAAVRSAAWCSSDPVCIESQGQGTDSANLAACHGCALLPETSCEEGNRLLDRAMLTGVPQKPDIGFFSRFIDT